MDQEIKGNLFFLEILEGFLTCSVYINYISTYTREALVSLNSDQNIKFKYKSGHIKGINGFNRNHDIATIFPLHVVTSEIFRSIETFSVNYIESTKKRVSHEIITYCR